MLLPPALGFSPHPPVSVYGTGICHTIAAFLDSWNPALRYFCSLRITALHYRAGFLTLLLLRLHQSFHSWLAVSFCVPTVLMTDGTGISTCCPSTTLFSLALGPDFPRAESALLWKPWIFGLEDSHLHLATHSGILSSQHSTAPYGTASPRWQCSSTTPLKES